MSHSPMRAWLTLLAAWTATACGGSDGGSTGPDLDAVASVTLLTPTATMDVGFTTTLLVDVRKGRGEQVSISIVFSSSAPAVASVTSSGLVTSGAEGVAVITATAGGIADQATVSVYEPTVWLTASEGCESTCGLTDPAGTRSRLFREGVKLPAASR